MKCLPVSVLGFRFYGLGFGVSGFGFRISGLGLRVSGGLPERLAAPESTREGVVDAVCLRRLSTAAAWGSVGNGSVSVGHAYTSV